MLRAEPGEPEVLADLLICGRREDQVARRLEALARERGDRDRVRGDLALHVERAAAPDLAVSQLARPWIELPLDRVGDHGVRVREQQQPRPGGSARNPSHEVCPLGHLRVQLGVHTALREVVTEELGGDRLVAGRVDRVEPDQPLEKVGCLLAEGQRRHQRRRPVTSR